MTKAQQWRKFQIRNNANSHALLQNSQYVLYANNKKLTLKTRYNKNFFTIY